MITAANPSSIRIKELGRVKEVRKIIAKVGGLTGFMNGQIVTFASGTTGLIMGFSRDDILVLILGDEASVRTGQLVSNVQEEFRVPVGERSLGRIISAQGQPIDGKGMIKADDYYPVFRQAPSTMDREAPNSCLLTGTKILDAIVPISKGQRQLIIGDRMTGKTTLAVDAILNQKDKGVVCVYCCIGKSFSSLVKATRLLAAAGAFDYTMVVAAPASASVGEQYLAPYTAASLAEYFFYNGRDALVVFDDMTKHAWSYRQISLLLERPPGREAYPGDIYYVHSQLLERAGKLKDDATRGGSMTFFPIVDTLQGDITGFIPSNLVSMTDGQIFLNPALFSEGFKPAIDFTMSVSIIGSRTQNPALKKLSANIRLEYAQYRELLRLTKLKSGLTPETQAKIRRGEVICALLAQDKNSPVSIGELVILLYALDRKIPDEFDVNKIVKFRNEIWGYFKINNSALAGKLGVIPELTPEIRAEMDAVFVEYFKICDQRGN